MFANFGRCAAYLCGMRITLTNLNIMINGILSNPVGGGYKSPELDVIEISIEGLLCASLNGVGIDSVEEMEWDEL